MKKDDFLKCAICNKKIGWFRRLRGDKSCMKLIPSNQFCSNKCNREALDLLLNKNDEVKK